MDASRRQLVIVALPAEDDPVRRYSSEKEPHLTLLYLGDPDLTQSELSNAILYTGFAASQLRQFNLDVTKRGELGDKKADVLFFKTNWTPEIVDFRTNLLKNEFINRAYLSANQFPDWVPHLTMGYPETPAKIEPGYDIFYTVRFDRIALWTEDSEGPTFPLADRDYTEVSMEQSQDAVRDFLAHYGVKGMKWGVRRSQPELDADSGDVSAVKVSKAKIKKNAGRTDSLSNKELQQVVNRMNLEQQYSKLAKDTSTVTRGHKKTQEILNKSKLLSDIYNTVNSPAGKAATTLIRKAVVGV